VSRALVPLGQEQRLDWVRLARTPGVGPLTFWRLLARCGAASEALSALADLSQGRLRPAPRSEAEQELEACAARGVRILGALEPAYPDLLRQIDNPPPILSVLGDVKLWRRPCVAIVGAREASAAGLRIAADMARGLGQAGVTVVSGLARGVDASAHRASLETGTVAVLAGGLAQPYPPQNLDLFSEICARGAAVSTAPLQAVGRAQDFPRRNYVISGLSLGVVVAEAAVRSGSLITARAAAEQGREVMAVPSSPLDPRGRGGNALLRDGASLVEGAEDVLAHLDAAPGLLRRAARSGEQPSPFSPPPQTGVDDGVRDHLARLLSPTPVHVNELARLVAANAGAVTAALLELELAGRAASLPGGFYVSPLS